MEDLPLKKIVKKITLPTISYSSKNLTDKDEAIDLVSSTNRAFVMKSSMKRAVNNEDSHEDPPPSFQRPPRSSQGPRVYT